MVRHQIYLFCCILLLLGLWFFPGTISSVSASVELLYFIGTPGEVRVQLDWETATEIDHAGFFLSRSTEASGGFVHIGEFIPAQGDSITGAYYSYIDNEVTNGISYYYILESWSVGNTVEFSDPISVTPGSASPTPTATETRTSTPTSSPSPTLTEDPSETRTPTTTPEDSEETPTPTSTVTRTSTPAPTITTAPTSTPTLVHTDVPPAIPTPTMVDTSPGLPRATLIPLPTIIVIYPNAEITNPTATSTPSPMPTETQGSIDDYVKTGFKVIGVTGLVCVVGMLWLLLVIWIVLLINRVRT